ncbi:hypothetical protein BX666DRAFT_1993128 [Dichotomocladium elegans]|nr:hypothetical protein BX666DRAFT_1993128 [Dichotomocladium elegans]
MSHGREVKTESLYPAGSRFACLRAGLPLLFFPSCVACACSCRRFAIASTPAALIFYCCLCVPALTGVICRCPVFRSFRSRHCAPSEPLLLFLALARALSLPSRRLCFWHPLTITSGAACPWFCRRSWRAIHPPPRLSPRAHLDTPGVSREYQLLT